MDLSNTFLCVVLNQPVSSPGDQKHKMPTSRCVRLMLVGIANNVKEMWIAQQPFLLMFYLWQYTPTFAMFITQKMGKIRVENFKAGLVGRTFFNVLNMNHKMVQTDTVGDL